MLLASCSDRLRRARRAHHFEADVWGAYVAIEVLFIKFESSGHMLLGSAMFSVSMEC